MQHCLGSAEVHKRRCQYCVQNIDGHKGGTSRSVWYDFLCVTTLDVSIVLVILRFTKVDVRIAWGALLDLISSTVILSDQTPCDLI